MSYSNRSRNAAFIGTSYNINVLATEAERAAFRGTSEHVNSAEIAAYRDDLRLF